MMKSLPRKIVALSFISLALPVSLLADEFVNISEIKECRGIAATAERLLCYDTVADGGIFNEQQLQQVRKENFGKTEEQPAEVSIDRLAVTIVRISKSASGTYYFYTEDGAAWKQSNSGRWSLKAPFQAEINAGLMGSFFLVAEGGKSVRVKRVQ